MNSRISHHNGDINEPPIMFMPDVTIPIVKQILVISTNTAQPSAIRELVFHPLLRLLDSEVSLLLSGLRSGCGVLAKGSGVYAVALLRSGLNVFALGRLEPTVGGTGVNCKFSVDERC